MDLSKYDPVLELTVIEKGAIYKAKDVLDRLNIGKKIGIVCDKFTHVIAGNKLKDVLEDYDVQFYDITSANFDEAYRVKEFIEASNRDLLMGVGGGRSIDVAKYGSHISDKRFVSVPTIASHDGIVSSRASLNNRSGKSSFDAQAPIALIADIEIIQSAPHMNYHAGVGDIITNITAINDWYLAYEMGKAKDYNRDIANTSLECANKIFKNPDQMHAPTEYSIKTLLEAIVISGKLMAATKSSRPASGFEHKISHKLDEFLATPNLHGLQCALGSLVSAAFYEEIGVEQDAGYNFDTFSKIYKQHTGLPVSAKNLSITRETMIEAVSHANPINSQRYTIGNHAKLNIESCLKKYGIID